MAAGTGGSSDLSGGLRLPGHRTAGLFALFKDSRGAVFLRRHPVDHGISRGTAALSDRGLPDCHFGSASGHQLSDPGDILLPFPVTGHLLSRPLFHCLGHPHSSPHPCGDEKGCGGARSDGTRIFAGITEEPASIACPAEAEVSGQSMY